MLFTADQLVAHAVGDYIIQSDWMADNKTKSDVAALIHAATYTLPFLLITTDALALAWILMTHFFIDRYRLSRFVNWFKNGPLARVEIVKHKGGTAYLSAEYHWKPVTATGYPETKPAFIATWLNIITDNIMHVACNGLAIAVFGGLA